MKLILAVDEKGGIAKGGKIPWKVPGDMTFFKRMTLGHTIIMGRKTFESIGRELPGRVNFIIGKNHFTDEEALSRARELEEKEGKKIFIIGGAQIANMFASDITEIFLTLIPGDFECDLFLPKKFRYLIDPTPGAVWKFASYVYHEEPTFKVLHAFPENVEESRIQHIIHNIRDEPVLDDRTGVGTVGVFGEQLKFSLRNGSFPISTLRKAFFRGMFEELMWFIRGETDAKILEEKKVNIWNGNSSRKALDSLNLPYPEGECGPIYGHQWRKWDDHGETLLKVKDYIDSHRVLNPSDLDVILNTPHPRDQLGELIINIRNRTPKHLRRLILTGWNVPDIDKMCLPPCHVMYQFDIRHDELSCHMYQRSSDIFLAGHWNVSTAALLTILIAKVTGFKPGELTVSYGNVHVYQNQLPFLNEYLSRVAFPYPKLTLDDKREIEDFTFEDLKLDGYHFHPPIAEIPMNV